MIIVIKWTNSLYTKLATKNAYEKSGALFFSLVELAEKN